MRSAAHRDAVRGVGGRQLPLPCHGGCTVARRPPVRCALCGCVSILCDLVGTPPEWATTSTSSWWVYRGPAASAPLRLCGCICILCALVGTPPEWASNYLYSGIVGWVGAKWLQTRPEAAALYFVVAHGATHGAARGAASVEHPHPPTHPTLPWEGGNERLISLSPARRRRAWAGSCST